MIYVIWVQANEIYIFKDNHYTCYWYANVLRWISQNAQVQIKQVIVWFVRLYGKIIRELNPVDYLPV